MKARNVFRYDHHYRTEIAGIVRGSGRLKSVSDQIRDYEAMEKQCDDLLSRQDALRQAIFGRVPADAPFRMTDRPFEEFRGAVDMAQKCIHRALPLSTRRFLENLDTSEMSQIERIEQQIADLRRDMQRQEETIMEYLPRSLEDVSAKLKFVVSLMLDGQEIETDYFAYLVEECAEVMDGSITGLRAAASIHDERGW
jgi:hypothetical protein